MSDESESWLIGQEQGGMTPPPPPYEVAHTIPDAGLPIRLKIFPPKPRGAFVRVVLGSKKREPWAKSMSLWPHLHLLVPSSTPGVNLEVRLYLPVELRDALRPGPGDEVGGGGAWADHARGKPIHWDELAEDVKRQLREVGVQRLIVASHPWAKLGGNMLFPVLSQHLTSAIYNAPPPKGPSTVLVTFNVRGVGYSQGRASWFGLGRDQDSTDFASMELWAYTALGGSPTDVRRVKGYSWGTHAALNAPLPPSPWPLSSTLLVAPPLPYFRLLNAWSSSFTAQVNTRLSTPLSQVEPDKGDKEGMTKTSSSVWVVSGTKDDFTSEESYDAFSAEVGAPHDAHAAGSEQGVQMRKVEGANHFFTNPGDGPGLIAIMREWLSL